MQHQLKIACQTFQNNFEPNNMQKSFNAFSYENNLKMELSLLSCDSVKKALFFHNSHITRKRMAEIVTANNGDLFLAIIIDPVGFPPKKPFIKHICA